MSITDELREYVKDHTNWGVVLTSYPPQRTMTYHEDELDTIVNGIDAEHQKVCDDAWDNGYEADYLGIEKWLTEHPQVMELHGWVCPPRDADGKVIRIGDVMKGEKIGGGFCEPFEVVGYIMSNGELEPMDEHRNARKSKYSHHHKQPTVEDVLREFALACEDAGNAGPEVARIAAEYAAKLRLAGMEDE